jgi:hypothetical protein
MTEEEKKREQRKQRRLATLGTPTPRCLCGETFWACFEVHHLAGQAYDPATLPVCTNCHRKLTQDQKDRAPPPPETEEWRVRLYNILCGAADVLVLIASKLIEIARDLLVCSNSKQEA